MKWIFFNQGEDAKETPVPDVENEVRPRFSAYSGRDRDGQKETSHQDPTSWEGKAEKRRENKNASVD